MKNSNVALPNQQSGITLIVGLIMLLLITMIGVNSMQDTNLQERMTMNIRDKNIALQGAESSLRDAEKTLFQVGSCEFDDANGCLSDGTMEFPNDATYLAGDNTSNAFNWDLGIETSNVDLKLSSPPKWVINKFNGGVCNKNSGSLQTTSNTGNCPFYRITTRSTGLSENTLVILQATYKTE
jgi:type IV pilus assembly protein PilX